jgi:hypothetical protein
MATRVSTIPPAIRRHPIDRSSIAILIPCRDGGVKDDMSEDSCVGNL